MNHEPNQSDIDAESSLRQSWSIGPLRPWLLRIAAREIPRDMQGKIEPSDVVQQTLLDAWRAGSQFRGTCHEQRLAWLRAILRRTILQQQRTLGTLKRGAEQALNLAIDQSSVRIEELAIGKEPAPDEAIINAEQSLILSEALERLPEDYRRVIEFRHFKQLPHATIATMMDRSPESVRMLWVRALVSLREGVNLIDRAKG